MDFFKNKITDYALESVTGRYTEGDGITVPASVDPAAFNNAVTDEIVNVIKGAALTPDETQVNQLFNAIKKLSGPGHLVQLSNSTPQALTANVYNDVQFNTIERDDTGLLTGGTITHVPVPANVNFARISAASTIDDTTTPNLALSILSFIDDNTLNLLYSANQITRDPNIAGYPSVSIITGWLPVVQYQQLSVGLYVNAALNTFAGLNWMQVEFIHRGE